MELQQLPKPVLFPEPVLWWEGMLLTPQHLQQNDIYWAHQMVHQRAHVQPYFWGLVKLELDQKLLGEGKIKVDQLQAAMPDGTMVQFPSPHQGQEPITAKELAFDATSLRDWDGGPIKIYLALPSRDVGAASPEASNQRYDQVPGREATDENTGEHKVAVPRLRPRLKLLCGPVDATRIGMPILEIKKLSLKGDVRPTSYHPPLLRIEGADFLQACSLRRKLGELIAKIRNKAKTLVGGDASDSGSASVKPTPQQVPIVQNLVSALPPLEVLVDSGKAHPFDLYLSLAHLVGEMSSIGRTAMPIELLKYEHDDIRKCFEDAIDHLNNRLDQVHGLYDVSEFTQADPGIFEHELDKAIAFDRLYVELKRQSGQELDALERWMSGARVGADWLMPILRQRRLTGATVRRLSSHRLSELGFREDSIIYKLESTPVDGYGVFDAQEIDDAEEGRKIKDRLLRIEGPSSVEAPAKVVLIQLSNSQLDSDTETAGGGES